ncbi:MAG: creatininase family protein [Chloroflexota bacterium]|nr:creatininase family protein [Chloroflexota bacterium]MDE2920679.1 creatininase family protein [Chloroflexota bacterium]
MDAPVERRWERCRPQQIWDALAEFPCVYVPSGPLEWHGRQNAVGLDAVKSTAICRRAAERTGGLVYPTVFLGAWEVPWPLGMPAAPDLIQSNAQTVLDYLARNGVRVVIWLGGHGGSEDYLAYRRAALDAMRQSDILVLAAVDSQLLGDFEKPMDHAAAIETSIMMYLHPETVDLDALDPAPDKWPEGVGGDDPRTHASRERGEHYAETLIDRIADAARRLVALDDQVERRKHRQCVAQQVAMDDMVVFGRAYLASADSPGKTPNPAWLEHQEAYRVGDYDRALAAGSKAIEATRQATAGRRPAGFDGERIV